MAEQQDPTLAVLREIKQEIQGTNARLDQTNARLETLDNRVDQTNTRLDQTNAHLEQTNARLETLDNRVDFHGRRQTEAEIRLTTEVVGVAKVLGEVKDLLVERLDEHGRFEDHEQRITALEGKPG